MLCGGPEGKLVAAKKRMAIKVSSKVVVLLRG